MKYCINGLFLSQRLTGVQRFATEILIHIDKRVEKQELIVVCPRGTLKKSTIRLNNIPIIEIGHMKGIIWEQTDLAVYCKKKRLISINLCNEQPLLYPGIICIHDVAYKNHPEFFTSIYGKMSVLWHRVVYRISSMSKFMILTVSQFSKDEIVKEYRIHPERIYVIGNAWQHISSILADESIISTNGLAKGEYYFALGNLSLNKNFRWIIENAKEHPHNLYVVCGNQVKNSHFNFNQNNILYLGYVTDEQIKALMTHCKAFIFPSIYEGFGIPPLEALSLGCKVVVSKIPVLIEIFGPSVYYIDPFNPDIDLDELLQKETYGRDDVLQRFSWEKSAEDLLSLVRNNESTDC